MAHFVENSLWYGHHSEEVLSLQWLSDNWFCTCWVICPLHCIVRRRFAWADRQLGTGAGMPRCVHSCNVTPIRTGLVWHDKEQENQQTLWCWMTKSRRTSKQYGMAWQGTGDKANIMVWQYKKQGTQQTLWCGIKKSRRHSKHYGVA